MFAAIMQLFYRFFEYFRVKMHALYCPCGWKIRSLWKAKGYSKDEKRA